MRTIFGTEYMSTKEAAEFLNVSRAWMEQKRYEEKTGPDKGIVGPRWFKLAGKVLYSKKDLEKWIIDNMVEGE